LRCNQQFNNTLVFFNLEEKFKLWHPCSCFPHCHDRGKNCMQTGNCNVCARETNGVRTRNVWLAHTKLSCAQEKLSCVHEKRD